MIVEARNVDEDSPLSAGVHAGWENPRMLGAAKKMIEPRIRREAGHPERSMLRRTGRVDGLIHRLEPERLEGDSGQGTIVVSKEHIVFAAVN
jgi:hypothetical protein